MHVMRRLIGNYKGEIVYKRKARVAQKNEQPRADVEALRARLTPAHNQILQILENQASLFQLTSTTFTLELAGRRHLPKLPPAYFFKGSAPRELLRRILFPKGRTLKVRDYDLVRFTESCDTQDHELALKYMEDDYEFGRGVEVIESKEVYFKTRDLTVNEVLFWDRYLEASFAAAQDLQDGVLRPTPYVLDAEGNVQGRTLMKALRLWAEALVQNIPLELEGFPESAHAVPFDVALHLDRAFALSRETAQEYVIAAWRRGIIMPQRDTPPSLAETVKSLSKQLKQGLAFFHHLPLDVMHELSFS